MKPRPRRVVSCCSLMAAVPPTIVRVVAPAVRRLRSSARMGSGVVSRRVTRTGAFWMPARKLAASASGVRPDSPLARMTLVDAVVPATARYRALMAAEVS